LFKNNRVWYDERYPGMDSRNAAGGFVRFRTKAAALILRSFSI